MSEIIPKNLTADFLKFELRHHGAGNPPQTHPTTAVGNFFPGLEFNFQNVWKRIFIGIDLLEYGGQVIAVNEAEIDHMTPSEIAALKEVEGGYLANVDGHELAVAIEGPKVPDGAPEVLGQVYLEWSNALSRLHTEKGGTGQTAACTFTVSARSADGRCVCDERRGPFNLKVRRLIDPGTGLISREASQPGEITESLCSPWQTDYIGCACYYWASNRPDYVNIDKEKDAAGADTGKSAGNNWLNVERIRDDKNNPFYTLREERLLQHEDVMKGWEQKFQFVVKSRDIPDGVVR